MKADYLINMLNPYAIFDTLFIVSQTRLQYGGISLVELNFMSYFSCLLSLYKGNAVSGWGYSFLKSERGVPVSAELSESCALLSETHELSKDLVCFNITAKGLSRLAFFNTLSDMQWRTEYLQAACDCLLTDSIVDILATISNDSVITESSVHTTKYLNSEENVSLSMLYQQFGTIKEAIGYRSNLFIPATSWLLYLRQRKG